MISRSLIAGAVIPLWLAACATQLPAEQDVEDRMAKQFTPDPERATIHIFRKSSAFAGFLGAMVEEQQGMAFFIHFDGQAIGKLRTWEFFRFTAVPGSHDFVATNTGSGRQTRISLNVEKGQLYFVEVKAYDGRFRPMPPPHLSPVDEKTGKQAVLDSTVVMLETEPKMLR